MKNKEKNRKREPIHSIVTVTVGDGVAYPEHLHVQCPSCGNIDFKGSKVDSVCATKPALVVLCGNCGKHSTIKWKV